jgi:uncharacterized protein YheU (UPF0270 family)
MAIPENGVEVPYTRLAADVLRRVAEEFVTRDGTDYGTSERTLDEKVSALRRQLERGDAAIVCDLESGTINIVPTHALRQRAVGGGTAVQTNEEAASGQDEGHEPAAARRCTP